MFPRLADGDHQRCTETFTERCKNPAHAIGIHVVEKVERQAYAMVLKSTNHEQRTEGTAANPDPKDIRKRLAVGGLNGSRNDRLAELIDGIDFSGDALANLLFWR